MSQRIPLLATLVLTAAIPLAARATPLFEDQLKPADHAALGKSISAFFAARVKGTGISKAQEDLADELEKVKKKMKGRDPLSMTSDLGKALWESFAYPSQKGVKKGKISNATTPAPYLGEKKSLEYAVSVPAKYDPKQPYPVLLCIPEKGATPQQHLTERWTSQEIRDGAVLVAIPMPDDVSNWGATGGEDHPGGLGNTFTVFNEVRRIYAVDFDRIYLCGRGEGVIAAMAIAERSPDRFAGVSGRAGDAGASEPDNFRNLPTFFAGAGAGATAFQEKAEKLAPGSSTVKPEADEAEIWTWMQQHPRAAYPKEIILTPGSEGPFRAYWIATPRTDAKTHLVAKADRASNTITIDGEGATSVVLFFNDVLVDLEKPVKVLCNGKEHLDLVPRSLVSMLDMLETPSDPGKLFTATRSYDLPAKPTPK